MSRVNNLSNQKLMSLAPSRGNGDEAPRAPERSGDLRRLYTIHGETWHARPSNAGR